jgi:spectinomycin phosphotransferase
MLEPPDLSDAALRACLREAYAVRAAQIEFLPLGADLNTVVYRAVADDGTPHFVKLRRGAFDKASVALPRWLSDQGVAQIIPPEATVGGQLWAQLDGFTVVLYPFVEGQNGYAVPLSARHWHDFGAALNMLHTAALPPEIMQHIPSERYDDQGRRTVERFVAQGAGLPPIDAVAAQMAAFLESRRAEVLDLVARADQLAQLLQARRPDPVVCHADTHAGNLLIAADGRLYIVDWDTLILAPKERDLMFVGGALGFVGHTAQEEQDLFYAGYGPAQIDRVALAYYRYERIIQDIAIFCEQIFLTAEGGDDRPQALRYLMSNFWPGGTIAMARAADSGGR